MHTLCIYIGVLEKKLYYFCNVNIKHKSKLTALGISDNLIDFLNIYKEYDRGCQDKASLYSIFNSDTDKIA